MWRPAEGTAKAGGPGDTGTDSMHTTVSSTSTSSSSTGTAAAALQTTCTVTTADRENPPEPELGARCALESEGVNVM